MKDMDKLIAQVKAGTIEYKGFEVKRKSGYYSDKYIATNGNHIIIAQELKKVLKNIDHYHKER